MFERFSEQARDAVVHAREEARLLRHDHIGTEHLLLGLLRVEETAAAHALAGLGVTPGHVREGIARIIGPGDEARTGHVPFTPRAKKVMELSLRETLSLGHRSIGAEHILLGLLREGGGVAARILSDAGADPDRLADALFREAGWKRPAGYALRPLRPGEEEAPAVTGLASPATRLAAWLPTFLLAALLLGLGVLVGWLIWG